MSDSPAPAQTAVSSNLMDNFLAATSIDASFPLAAAEDEGGSPILFSVGASAADSARQVMWVMLRDTTVQTGWRQVELSPVTNANVQSYSVIQGTNGTILVAVAVDDLAGGSHVYVSPLIKPTIDGAPWDTLNQSWSPRSGGPGGAPVIRLVTGDFHATSPLLLVEVQAPGSAVRRYTLPTDGADPGVWYDWQPPQQVGVLHDVVVGRASITGVSYSGTWTLYEDNTQQLRLMFTSLVDNTGSVHNLSVSPPDGATCLAALPDTGNQGLSHLYVGGKGLSWFPSTTLKNSRSVATPITDAGLLSGVSSVLVGQDSDKVSVWAVDASQNLYYVNNTLGAVSGWSQPVLHGQHVAHIAARRNNTRGANEVFYTTSNNQTVSYLWQDRTTTTWQSTDIVLPAQGDGQQFISYSTVVRFTDAQGAVLANRAVRLTASAWTWAMVNGYWTSLDPDAAVSVQTDILGTVTIINKVADIGTAIYTFEADFLPQPVIADPSAELRASLVGRLQGGDLSTWSRPDGSPVVPAGADPARVAQAQDALDQLSAYLPTLPPDGSAAVATPAPATQSLLVRPTSFGVISDLGDAIETAAGDVLHALQTAVGAVYDYVIQPAIGAAEDLLQFFVQIGEQVLTFVIRTVQEALQLISWLFQEIGVLLEDLVQLLGFLFAWDDILNTQRVLEAGTKDVFLWLGAQITNAGPVIAGWFNQLIDSWDDIVNQVLAGNDIAIGQGASQVRAQATPEQQSVNSCLTTSPGATFSTYQLTHGGFGSGTLTGLDGDHPISQAVIDVLQTAMDVIKDVSSTVIDLLQNVLAMIRGGSFTLKGLVALLVGEVVQEILEAARDILVGLTTVIGDITTAMVEDLFSRPIHIPVVTWLYQKLTQEDSLTVLGALCLLGAIPGTIAYKLIKGVAPFTDAEVQQVLAADPSPGSSFVALPWRMRGGLVLAADLDPSSSARAMMVKYSHVFGVVGMIFSFFYPLCLAGTVDQQLKSEKDKAAQVLFAMLQAICTCVAVACTFPFDEDTVQEVMDLILWMVSVVEAIFTSCTALLGVVIHNMPEPTPALKAAKEVCETSDFIALGLVSLVGFIVAIGSLIAELLTDPKPSYHTDFWDSEKFFANGFRSTGIGLECVGGATEQWDLLGVAVIEEVLASGLDGLRWFDAVVQDHLYQPT